MTKDVFIKEVRDAEAMLYHISKSILKNDSDFIFRSITGNIICCVCPI